MNKAIEYYNGDEFSAGVWKNKYALKNENQEVIEETPRDMHKRMVKELARAEGAYGKHINPELKEKLSDFGKWFQDEFWGVESGFPEDFIFKYFDKFKYIIPQGSIMSMLGNKYKIGSLSNCFVIPSPLDSYGGIFKTDQQLAQLAKRRGGVGMNIDTLRPENTPVLNAAGSSTGAHSFMDRFSNTTREVAQNGRRGALMLLMGCKHPDIFKFVIKKKDLTKVTGANISVILTDDFMRAATEDKDFYCTFPVNTSHPPLLELNIGEENDTPYNELIDLRVYGWSCKYAMRIRAKELFDLIVEMAWQNGEPGVAFIDRITSYCPEGVYSQFAPIASNPCGEQWMQAYDACRLLALNFFNIVINAWKSGAYIDFDKLYEIAYIQQRLADDVVDLEIEYVQRIIDKIKSDPEPDDVKAIELDLWVNIKATAEASRRTGCGFTGLADMLAALGLKYDSDEAIQVIEKVMKTKMRAELDCTIDLAILRGTFKGWDVDKEFPTNGRPTSDEGYWFDGGNDFYKMLLDEFPEQCTRMQKYGRRNASWSTVAPTGTMSIITILNKYANISAGIEPNFLPYFFRNVKVVEGNDRVDFVDAQGDSWKTSAVVMGGFKEWVTANYIDVLDNQPTKVENLTKERIEELFKESPYFGSCANDISWEKRIEIQAIVQRYTTNAISSTLNLPKDVTKETVAGIYEQAWKKGLKGVTIYRDGCRTGILNAENKKEGFKYQDAIKRPKEIDADLHIVTAQGIKYAVIVGKFDNRPYELFAFKASDELVKTGSLKGRVVKGRRGHYNFVNCVEGNTIKDLQIVAEPGEEQILTRLISGMLRHGAKPQFVMEQIDKCDMEIVSFGKAISRILKKYCSDEDMVKRNTCSNCGSSNVKMQEGCLTCSDCGFSKCG